MPLYAMIGRDGTRGAELRKLHRAAHLEGLEPLDRAGRIHHAGPLLDEGGAPTGSLVIFEAPDLASARAIATIDGAGLLDEDELPGAKKVLRAAALTYVAALLMSLLQLMRFVLIFIGRGGRDQGGSQ